MGAVVCASDAGLCVGDFSLQGGMCALAGGCVHSPKYPSYFPHGKAEGICAINAGLPRTLFVDYFHLPAGAFLRVNGVAYEGTVTVQGLVVSATYK